MGKGIALQFREAFPHNYKKYQDACKKKLLQPGILLAVWDNNLQSGQKLIINFPTKVHWRNPSQYEYIEKGLDALRDLLLEKPIKSIAIPALGSGNGGLDWQRVKPLIETKLTDLDVDIQVYEPTADIKVIL